MLEVGSASDVVWFDCRVARVERVEDILSISYRIEWLDGWQELIVDLREEKSRDGYGKRGGGWMDGWKEEK